MTSSIAKDCTIFVCQPTAVYVDLARSKRECKADGVCAGVWIVVGRLDLITDPRRLFKPDASIGAIWDRPVRPATCMDATKKTYDHPKVDRMLYATR